MSNNWFGFMIWFNNGKSEVINENYNLKNGKSNIINGKSLSIMVNQMELMAEFVLRAIIVVNCL